jgi:1-deoxy-D-xylulose-5-phosphate synthase
MVYPAVEAARLLAQEGTSACIIDARFVKPLDRDLIVEKATLTGRVLTVEEGNVMGGFGSAVLELLSDEQSLHVRTARMGIPDQFVEHGTRSELLEELGLTPQGIAKRARDLMLEEPASNLRAFPLGQRR